MSGQKVGYVRVSSLSQKTDRQLDGLILNRIFEDKVSGKDLERPALQDMIAYVREGDQVIVHSMDRLGRNLTDLKTIIEQLNKKKVTVHFVKENLTLNSKKDPVSDLMMHIFAAVSEFEREKIRERQREGIELAKRRGAYKGRPPRFTPEQIKGIQNQYLEGASCKVLCAEHKISTSSLYLYLKDLPKLRQKIHTAENLKTMDL